ncbi:MULTISPECIES: hypothetical protein [Actinoplanes]|uniref:hypothetical protein n=1 Tax=Actinoplanes TaxID=1865 RepID=UPI0005F2BBC3|nr:MULTISPECIES: hypothetical protein [Actinoplanes]GLY06820.1 hypothetical protein Acsp01_71990 [Actinoplanes sp. NBRC 101535]
MQKRNWWRVLAALLTTLGLSAALISTTAGPASAATQINHKCAVIGTDQYGNQGVHCVNLNYEGGQAWSTNEVFCQSSGGVILECAGIHETPGLCNIASSACSYSPEGICGVRFGHSACGARRVVNSSPRAAFRCGVEYWGITIGTSIVLPRSGDTVGGGLVGTHDYVC